MSDEEENVPTFLEDARVKFIEGRVCGLLRLQSQTWEKTVLNEEVQKLLNDFFEKGSAVFFSSPKKGCLVATNEVRWSDNVGRKLNF